MPGHDGGKQWPPPPQPRLARRHPNSPPTTSWCRDTIPALRFLSATKDRRTCGHSSLRAPCCSSMAPLTRRTPRSICRSKAARGWIISPLTATTFICSTCAAMANPRARRRWRRTRTPIRRSCAPRPRSRTLPRSSISFSSGAAFRGSSCSAGRGARSRRRLTPSRIQIKLRGLRSMRRSGSARPAGSRTPTPAACRLTAR